MVEILCSVCFCPFEKNENKYTCAKKNCETFTCLDCLEALIQYSENNNLIPSCPKNNCNGIYTLSNIQGISSDALKNYESACLKNIMKENGDNIKKKIEQAKIIDKLRDDRLKFIETKFPKGIYLVSRLTFKDKMRKLDKQKGQIIKMRLQNANKSCFNLACNGFLDPDLVCMSCLTEFCKRCEKKLKKDHICKQEDLDSINLVNGLIHCPGCKLPVFKNEGCDSITCANCNTKFLYSTGKIGGHGSHNVKININIKEKKSLVTSLEDLIPQDCLELVLKFESLEPKFRSKDTILTPVKEYIQTGNENLAKKKVAKKIDQYVRYKYRSEVYNKKIVEVEDVLKESKDNEEKKNKLLQIMKSVT